MGFRKRLFKKELATYSIHGYVANPNLLGARDRIPHAVQSLTLQTPRSETDEQFGSDDETDGEFPPTSAKACLPSPLCLGLRRTHSVGWVSVSETCAILDLEIMHQRFKGMCWKTLKYFTTMTCGPRRTAVEDQHFAREASPSNRNRELLMGLVLLSRLSFAGFGLLRIVP